MRRRAPHGFTLIEVLIALAVVALALLALTRTAALEVRDFDMLRERTLAGWVAANVLAEARVSGALPPAGTSDGRVELGGRAWHWRREVSATADADIRRIDIRVYAGEATDPVASLSGFAAATLNP